MEKLDTLVKNDLWRKASGIRKDTRMKGTELALRFFAFRYDRSNYEKPLASFLDNFSSKNRNLDEAIVDKWSSEFNRVVELIDHALGKYAFRLFDPDLGGLTGFNSALYDAQMIAFAETDNGAILSKNFNTDQFRRAVGDLLLEEKFYNSIRQATSDEQSVKTRIETFKKFLDGYNEL